MDDFIADIRGKGKGAIENLLQKIFFNKDAHLFQLFKLSAWSGILFKGLIP